MEDHVRGLETLRLHARSLEDAPRFRDSFGRFVEEFARYMEATRKDARSSDTPPKRRKPSSSRGYRHG